MTRNLIKVLLFWAAYLHGLVTAQLFGHEIIFNKVNSHSGDGEPPEVDDKRDYSTAYYFN